MRILYGVVGEGMGHAIRSRVIIDHLIEEEHEVEIIASARAADYLSERYRDVHKIHGFHIVSEENRVRRGRTLLSNIVKGTAAVPRQIKTYFSLTEDFRPQAVISDFESWTSLYGETHRIPVFSIDNMQIIDRCEHPREMIRDHRTNYKIARAFVRGKLPFSEFFFITTFFYPPIKRERTVLTPPVLRKEILAATPAEGEHLLIYHTGKSHDELLHTLASAGMPCRIYGGSEAPFGTDTAQNNLSFCSFHEERFVTDLSSARAVVGSAGFTLMSECVYLHKPLLAIPLGDQFEQILNGKYLAREGYGMTTDEINGKILNEFIGQLPQFSRNLSRYAQNGNEVLFEALDEKLDLAAADLIELHP